MRVLEARFRSGVAGTDAFVVVGRLVWRQPDPAGDPVIQADPALLPVAAPPLVEKLRYLVNVTAPDSYQRLQSLRSRFWSFVDVTGVDGAGMDVATATKKGGS
jgi:hypothetical protein